MAKVNGSVALVTGANRGIGKAFVEELIAGGAAKVYAAARNTDSLQDLASQSSGKIVPVKLDVTNRGDIETAATALTDVDLLINNAGVAGFEGILSASNDAVARNEMAVNYFGVFDTTRAFAPVLKANGGGAIVNMASIASYVNFPALGSYSASKAAVHSLTQSTRAELAAQETEVFGVYPGPVDTDMAAEFPMEKTSPNEVVKAIFASVEAGEHDIYPDPMAVETYKNLLADPKAVEREVGGMLPA